MPKNMERKQSTISNDILFYDDKKIKLNPFFYQKRFELNFKKVAIIGFKNGYFFDDDYLVIVFISSCLKTYFLPFEYFTELDIKKMNQYFKVDLKMELEQYNSFEKLHNKIIFPEKLYGRVIFRKPNFLETFKLLLGKITFRKKYPSGQISTDVFNYISSIPAPAVASKTDC